MSVITARGLFMILECNYGINFVISCDKTNHTLIGGESSINGGCRPPDRKKTISLHEW